MRQYLNLDGAVCHGPPACRLLTFASILVEESLDTTTMMIVARLVSAFPLRSVLSGSRPTKSPGRTCVDEGSIRTISGFTGGYFCEIPVVVTFHLEVEYFALGTASLGDQVLIQETLQKHKYTDP